MLSWKSLQKRGQTNMLNSPIDHTNARALRRVILDLLDGHYNWWEIQDDSSNVTETRARKIQTLYETIVREGDL